MEDWRDRATSQEIPKIAVKPPEARGRHEWLPPQVSEGVWHCPHLDFRLPQSGMMRQ